MHSRSTLHAAPTRSALAAACWLALGACGHDQVLQTTPAVSAPPPASAPPAPPAAAAREPAPPSRAAKRPNEPYETFMTEHFVIATYARDCVIAGDIEALREPLMELAEFRYETVAPGTWLPGATELQAAARLTAQAETLDAAAIGVAMMGRICGDCHTEHGHGPRLGALARDLDYGDEGDTLSGRMHRHARGADQLWLGLTAPSNVVWEAGAKTIGDTPPLADSEYPSDFLEALAEVRTLGAQAVEATSNAERAVRYGALLTTCAECHARLLDHELE